VAFKSGKRSNRIKFHVDNCLREQGVTQLRRHYIILKSSGHGIDSYQLKPASVVNLDGVVIQTIDAARRHVPLDE